MCSKSNDRIHNKTTRHKSNQPTFILAQTRNYIRIIYLTIFIIYPPIIQCMWLYFFCIFIIFGMKTQNTFYLSKTIETFKFYELVNWRKPQENLVLLIYTKTNNRVLLEFINIVYKVSSFFSGWNVCVSSRIFHFIKKARYCKSRGLSFVIVRLYLPSSYWGDSALISSN